MKKGKFVIIDGNSLLYRAFFAMPPLTTSDNQPTNAAYGFTMMLLKIINDVKPNYIVVTFDARAKTFRHEEYEAYKAHRKPMPDELVSQLPIVMEIVRAFNIPIYQVEGVEADDVVGTIARKAESSGYDVLIVTGDLDELQLVDDTIKVITTVKGVTKTVIYDKQAVYDRFQISPELIPDYKALKGDTSDNIPGVKGIGEKTATELLKEFGSLENLLDNLDKVKDAKKRKVLEEYRDIAVQSKRLATIVTDVPIDLDFESCKYEGPDYRILRELFSRLEFKSLLARLPEEASATQPDLFNERNSIASAGTDYKLIDMKKDLTGLINTIARSGSIAFLQVYKVSAINWPTEITHLAISLDDGSRFVLSFNPNLQVDDVKEIFESETTDKITFDLKPQIKASSRYGIEIRGVKFDAMIAAYVLNPTGSSPIIESIAREYLQMELEPKGKNLDENMHQLSEKTGILMSLRPVLTQKIEECQLNRIFYDIEMPLVPVLADMELTGINVDMDWLKNLSRILGEKLDDIKTQIYALAGMEFNIGSPKQLQSVLYEKLGLPCTKKTKTGYSTDADTLKELAPMHEIVSLILDYRELSKLKSTYADSLPKLVNPETGRIHTSLNQTITSTGRLSSSDPNLQNIPIKTEIGREIRKAFIASEGNILVTADYSQIELRILAHISHDPNLIEAFNNRVDIHARTASTIFGVPENSVTPEMRRQAKTVNFAVIYGMSDYGLSRELGIPVGVARSYIENYFSKYPGVKWYTDKVLEWARANGYVMSLLGRRRYIPEINSKNKQTRELAERAAVNMPIQGTAADIIKIAMVNIWNKLRNDNYSTKLVLQVHDELIFDAHESEIAAIIPIVKEYMENAYKLDVPLEVEIKTGKDWCTAQPV